MARSGVDQMAEALEREASRDNHLALLQTMAVTMRSTADAILLILDAMAGDQPDQEDLEAAVAKVHTFGGQRNINQEEDSDGGE